MTIKCLYLHLFVTTTNNQLYIFEFMDPIQSTFWYQFLIIVAIALLITIVLIIRWYKKRK